MPSDAGRFRERVKVQRKAGDPSDTGQVDGRESDAWETVYNRWCAIAARASTQFALPEQVSSKVTHSVTLRLDSDSLAITPDMRFTWSIRGRERVLTIVDPGRHDDDKSELTFGVVEEQ